MTGNNGSSAHALLAPSSSKRWLTCTPSALKAAQSKNTTNTAAEEGTLAHQLAEYMLMQYEGRLTVGAYQQLLSEIKQNELYSDTMLKHCQAYAAYAIGLIEGLKSKDKRTVFFIERRFELDALFPDSGGTADLVIIGHRTLIVLDLKFGIVEYVPAKGNTQLRLYALAAYYSLKAEFLFIRSFEMHVYQPRRDNVSYDVMGLGELLNWGDKIKAAAIKASKGEGDYVAGEHCLYCPFKVRCKASYKYYFKLLDYMAKELTDELTDEDYQDIIKRGKGLIKWFSDIEQHLTKRISNGQPVDGLKLVSGKSYRSITNIDKLAKSLGLKREQVIEEKPLGITAIEKLVGKKELDKASQYITYVEGNAQLVLGTDPRKDLMVCTDFDSVDDFDVDDFDAVDLEENEYDFL